MPARSSAPRRRRRSGVLDDPPLVHEDDAVGDLAREAHLVRDDDHRHAVLRQPDHDVEHLVDHLGVERRGRLVEQHGDRIHGQRPGDGDALLLAAGEIARMLLGVIDEADAVEQFAGARTAAGLLRFRTLTWARQMFSVTVMCG